MTQTQNLSTFDFNETPVRVIDREGEPWFVLRDVCAVLEHTNPSKAASELDEDEKGLTNGYTLGGTQQLLIVSESGLYSLIFTSRMERAREFKRWVTKEVLPSIRKTGAYSAAGVQHLSSAEEEQVQGIINHLMAAIGDKREGKLTNGDAACLANLCCQFLKAYDVKLRLRAGSGAIAGGLTA